MKQQIKRRIKPLRFVLLLSLLASWLGACEGNLARRDQPKADTSGLPTVDSSGLPTVDSFGLPAADTAAQPRLDAQAPTDAARRDSAGPLADAGSPIPSGTVLFQEAFDNSSFSSRGWYDNTNHGAIVAGGQSGSCLEWTWAQGATKPPNGGSMRKKFTPSESLYVSFYVKFQAGWRGSGRSYHPHMLLIPCDLDSDYTPLANNILDTYIEFLADVNSPYAIRPFLAIQDQQRVNTSNGTPPNDLTAVTENRSVAYCNTPVPAGAHGTCYPDNPYYSANYWVANNVAVSPDAWHHVEVYFQMNTISGGKGQSNGIMREWIDGALVIDQQNVLYRTNQDATKKWAQFVLAPWIGDGSPIAQSMWLDELTVATGRP